MWEERWEAIMAWGKEPPPEDGYYWVRGCLVDDDGESVLDIIQILTTRGQEETWRTAYGCGDECGFDPDQRDPHHISAPPPNVEYWSERIPEPPANGGTKGGKR